MLHVPWVKLVRHEFSQRKKNSGFSDEKSKQEEWCGDCINIGEVQFCLLLYSERVQGPPLKCLSPLSVSESRVLKCVTLDAKPWSGFLCPAPGCPSAADTVRVSVVEILWWVRAKVDSRYHIVQQISRKRFTEGWGVKGHLRVGVRQADRQLGQTD